MSDVKPIETKVIASLSGAGAGAAFSQFLLWMLGVTVWDAPNSAGSAVDAVAAVPSPVAVLISVVVSAVAAGVSGWLAPHTPNAPELELLAARVDAGL